MKKIYLIFILIAILTVGWIFIKFVIGGNEDDWIKDSRGVYIKHGNPAEIPDYVLEQQEMINCATEKFNNFTEEKNSQCLGICRDYAVDIVHVPRNEEDNKPGNQCEDYRKEVVIHFVELDNKGEIVRII